MAWVLRYNTIDCIKVWKRYWNPGPAEATRGVAPECVRVGVKRAAGRAAKGVAGAAAAAGVAVPLAILPTPATHPGASWGGLGAGARDIAPYSTAGTTNDSYGGFGGIGLGFGSGGGFGPGGLGGFGSGGGDRDGLPRGVLDLAFAGPGPAPGLTPDVLPDLFAPSLEPVPVPEPTTLLVMAAGLLGLTLVRHRHLRGRNQ